MYNHWCEIQMIINLNSFLCFFTFLFSEFVLREAVRRAVQMTSFGVTTTSASHSSGCVTVKKTARWGKMKKTAMEQV